jgi:hypothetical protein
VHWSGKDRAALTGQAIYLRPLQDRSPYGSVSAARPNLSFAQGCPDFLSWLPSSAVSPDADRHVECQQPRASEKDPIFRVTDPR